MESSLNFSKINSSSLNTFFNVQTLETSVTLSTPSLKLVDFHDCDLQTFKESGKPMIFSNDGLSNSVTVSNSQAHLISLDILVIIHSSVDSPIMQSSQSDLIKKLKDLFFEGKKHTAVMSINSDVSLFDCERSIMNSDNHIALHFPASFFQD